MKQRKRAAGRKRKSISTTSHSRGGSAPPSLKITFGQSPTGSPWNDPVRGVLGRVTPQGKALADILALNDPEISAFLQDSTNREALAKDPLRALSKVLPREVIKSLGRPVRLPP